MKMAILTCALAAALCGALAAADSNEATAREVIALERTALDGWQVGNPDPLLAISDPEITYFHVMTGQRLDGLPAVKSALRRLPRPASCSTAMKWPSQRCNRAATPRS